MNLRPRRIARHRSFPSGEGVSHTQQIEDAREGTPISDPERPDRVAWNLRHLVRVARKPGGKRCTVWFHDVAPRVTGCQPQLDRAGQPDGLRARRFSYERLDP